MYEKARVKKEEVKREKKEEGVDKNLKVEAEKAAGEKKEEFDQFSVKIKESIKKSVTSKRSSVRSKQIFLKKEFKEDIERKSRNRKKLKISTPIFGGSEALNFSTQKKKIENYSPISFGSQSQVKQTNAKVEESQSDLNLEPILLRLGDVSSNLNKLSLEVKNVHKKINLMQCFLEFKLGIEGTSQKIEQKKEGDIQNLKTEKQQTTEKKKMKREKKNPIYRTGEKIEPKAEKREEDTGRAQLDYLIHNPQYKQPNKIFGRFLGKRDFYRK